MAYADTLDEAAPAGTDLISLGDDSIRKVVRAIRERLESIVVDVDADPMVLKSTALVTADGSITVIKMATGVGFALCIQGSLAFDLTVAAGTCETGVTAPALIGAVAGNPVYAALDVDSSYLVLSGHVSAANTVSWSVCNPTAGDITVAGNLILTVIKPI